MWNVCQIRSSIVNQSSFCGKDFLLYILQIYDKTADKAVQSVIQCITSSVSLTLFMSIFFKKIKKHIHISHHSLKVKCVHVVKINS